MHARYSLVIIIIQKYVKRMPICFARNRVCAISIARVGLQMRYREPKKLAFNGVYFKDVLEICAHLQAECRIKHARYFLIIIIKKKTKKITVQLQATHTLQLCKTQLDTLRTRRQAQFSQNIHDFSQENPYELKLPAQHNK